MSTDSVAWHNYLSQKWVKYSSTAVIEQFFNNMSKFP